ncbi:MAG TPA: permease-like cell division protein FtsX, partial [Burkholderiaceae bacterium]
MSFFAVRRAACGEALRLIGGRPGAWVGIVGSTGALLAALSLAALAAWNLQPLASGWLLGPEATVFMAPGASSADVAAIRDRLQHLARVGGVRFVARDAALAEIARRAPVAGAALADIKENPLPDAFVVSFEAGADPDAIDSAMAGIRRSGSVDSVQLDLGWYRKLLALAGLGRRVALLGAGVAATAVMGWLWISATTWVRIDPADARLLWLLGAHDRAIRRPSIYAGFLSAAAAAAAALALDWAALRWLEPAVVELAHRYSTAEAWRLELPPP